MFSCIIKNAEQREVSELLGLWTLSIALNSKYYKIQRFGNWICFRPQVKRGLFFLVFRIQDDGQSPETQ
jgi:hypothetical protein